MTNRHTIVLTMPRSSQPKQKRTFSLSAESLKYLEEVRKRKKAPSTSSVLDEMIREQKQMAGRRKLGDEITAYYDSLSDDDRQDNHAWGEFGESQFPRE
jgi:hypothetical protein